MRPIPLDSQLSFKLNGTPFIGIHEGSPILINQKRFHVCIPKLQVEEQQWLFPCIRHLIMSCLVMVSNHCKTHQHILQIMYKISFYPDITSERNLVFILLWNQYSLT